MTTIVGLALLVLGGTAWLMFGRWSNRTTPISVDELAERAGTTTSTTTSTTTPGIPGRAPSSTVDATPTIPATTIAPTGTTSPPAALPAAGVYAYRTAGTETLDLLTGIDRRYPEQTGIVVSHTQCGFDLSWRPYVERTYTIAVCHTDAGFVLSGYTNRYEFFGQPEQRQLSCEPAPAWIPSAWAVFETSCMGDGLTETRRGSSADDVVIVDGVQRPAVHIVIDTETTGSTAGTTHEELWVDVTTGLVLRLERSVSNETSTAAGSADYDEQVVLEVSALAPV